MAREEYVSVSMVREDLSGLPRYALPAGFSHGWYRPGDERLWVEIQASADRYNVITGELFESQFGRDAAAELGRRQCFLLDPAGRAAGTATAWFGDDYRGRSWGRVHWVAVAPAMQGRGLSKPLLAAVCERLRELGHARAYLTTAPERLPAINLYLKFGFVPELRDDGDPPVWGEIQEKLGRRILGPAPGGGA